MQKTPFYLVYSSFGLGVQLPHRPPPRGLRHCWKCSLILNRFLYCVYQKFRPKLGKRNELIIFGLLLTLFAVSSIFWGTWISCENFFKPWIKPPNQVKPVWIPDTHGRMSQQKWNWMLFIESFWVEERP